jgi:hypothetical protein
MLLPHALALPRPPLSPSIRARATRRRCRTAILLAGSLVVSAGCNSDISGSSGGNPTGLPTGSFDIGVPAAVAVRRENSTIVEVNITRSGYVAPIFVTISGLPTGVVGPSVSSTSTNQLRITLVADAQATLGPTTATVTAQGSDVPSVTKQFTLTVAP